MRAQLTATAGVRVGPGPPQSPPSHSRLLAVGEGLRGGGFLSVQGLQMASKTRAGFRFVSSRFLDGKETVWRRVLSLSLPHSLSLFQAKGKIGTFINNKVWRKVDVNNDGQASFMTGPHATACSAFCAWRHLLLPRGNAAQLPVACVVSMWLGEP